MFIARQCTKKASKTHYQLEAVLTNCKSCSRANIASIDFWSCYEEISEFSHSEMFPGWSRP